MVYNTRIAPSPTGDMHIGTARTAYFNWLAAKSTGGRFVLRIDDTDQKRSEAKHTQTIIDTMKWLGLLSDGDKLYLQSDNFDFYRKQADDLVSKGRASKRDGAIVLTHVNLPDTWHDNVVGDVAITADDREKVDGMVLMRSDGTPTYHWASVLDDIELGINLIIRGVDHVSNTARQVAIFRALDCPVPNFAHVGLICVKKKPLSKRDGAASMLHYRDSGYDPDAMLNFLLRLGWGPTVDDKSTAVIDKDKALELFVLGGQMRSAPASMDLQKLESYDRKYKARKGIWRTGQRLISE